MPVPSLQHAFAGSMLNAEELAKRAAQVAESNSSNRATYQWRFNNVIFWV